MNSEKCRLCVGGQVSGGSGWKRTFVIPASKPHYAPDTLVRLEHLKLDVKVDPSSKSVEGVATQRLRFVAEGLRVVRFDQIELDVLSCAIDGEPAEFEVASGSLAVKLPAALEPKFGDTHEFEIKYRARRPRRGLYFTKNDQVWSQGQDEDNRHWIPTLDYPNQKTTWEVIATVPRGFTAVSNGALLGSKDLGEWTRFHYRIDSAHVTYLISLVVAKLSAWEDKGPRGLPVQYFVAPGRESDGKRAFGNTPRMIEAFEKRTGVAYPYEKYSQVAVEEFIFGGMENSSATTQTDRVLLDEKAHVDFSGDPLVSHELAHQWFGDLVTCRDWSHGWLNEGFATFLERVWIEENIPEYGSREAALDEARYYGLTDLRDYLSEDETKYRRPIVCHSYIEPMDLFDMHLYQKGGLVLNLIRAQLGEEPFWKAIRLYLDRHRGGSVETLDLIRAIEDATGRNLRRLFDEWVFKAGYPEFELAYSWTEERKQVEIVVEQKQTGGRPEWLENGFITPIFHLETTIELVFPGGVETHRVSLSESRDRFVFPAPSKPSRVRFDPGGAIPKTLKFPRPAELLAEQLKSDPDVLGRIEAAHELAKLHDRIAFEALCAALKGDQFWGVRAEAASALAELKTAEAARALEGAVSDPHPKARKAIVVALGTLKGIARADSVKALTAGDPSYQVEAEAVRAWAALKVPSGATAELAAEGEKFLLSQLSRPSYHEVIRVAALEALAELPGVGKGDRPRSLDALIEWTGMEKPEDARLGAISALGKLGRAAAPAERVRILARFSELANEANFRLRMKLVHALGATEHADAVEILRRIARLDHDGRVRRSASTISEAVKTSGGVPESVERLRASLEKLETEVRELRAVAPKDARI